MVYVVTFIFACRKVRKYENTDEVLTTTVRYEEENFKHTLYL